MAKEDNEQEAERDEKETKHASQPGKGRRSRSSTSPKTTKLLGDDSEFRKNKRLDRIAETIKAVRTPKMRELRKKKRLG